MPFWIIEDDMSWKSTGAYVMFRDDVKKEGISVEKHSMIKYSFYIHPLALRGGGFSVEENLAHYYSSCLQMAASRDCESIVFPLWSRYVRELSRECEIRTICKVFSDFLDENELDIFLFVPDRRTSILPEEKFSEICNFLKAKERHGPDPGEYRRRAESYPSDADMSAPQTPRNVSGKSIFGGKGFNPDISDYITKQINGNFTDYLQRLINKKRMSNSEVYKRANLSKQYFSKLINGRINPTKEKLLCIAIALQLNLDETIDFLNMGGYAISPYSKTDLVFQYFIIKKDFDIFNIDIALYDLGLPSLMD